MSTGELALRAVSVPQAIWDGAGLHDDAFQEALRFTLRWEGGLSRDPRDPGNAGGNATFRGVTQPTYNAFRAQQGLAPRSVTHLKLDEAEHLYHQLFFVPIKAHRFPTDTAIALFDTAVNIGPNRAVRLLQQALQVDADGVVGPQTLSEATKQHEPSYLRRFIGLREEYYRSLATSDRFKPFLRGWLNRCHDLRQTLKL